MANYKQIYAIRRQNEKRILNLNPEITRGSGIYIFTRYDENGFKYAYVGQAVNVLERCASHLSGYRQHIDLSIKNHGLYEINERPNGWDLVATAAPPERLDELEQEYIKLYATLGYQLRNKTTGSQGVGKRSIEDKPRKGYLQGKRDGELKAAREIGTAIGKYTTGLTSKGGAVADRKTAELITRLNDKECDV